MSGRPRTPYRRRDVVRLLGLSPVALMLGKPEGLFAEVPHPGLEPRAGEWQLWSVYSHASLMPPGPAPGVSEQTELAAVVDAQARLGDAKRSVLSYWDREGGIPAWTEALLNLIRRERTDPVKAARALALFHTALADATVCAWRAKYAFKRLQPCQASPAVRCHSEAPASLPSYPSEHAVIAGAAAAVLDYLYPAESIEFHGQRMTPAEAAREAAKSRAWAGAAYPSDIEAGLRLGEAVGLVAVARGRDDGSMGQWDPRDDIRPIGSQYWVPTAPAHIYPPLHPVAGNWRPWLIESGSQFRCPVPPGREGTFPSKRFVDETMEVKRTVDQLNEKQLRIADFWADIPGASFTPPGHWAEVAVDHVSRARLSTPRAARALALVSVGLADSAIACWYNKYAYWLLRPITAIRTLQGQPFYDPNFTTPIETPPFPAYTSGHSTFSGCAAAVLENLLPGGKVQDAFGDLVSFREAAEQAAVSRLYGGIHYRSDNDEGLVCGRKIAGLVLDRARTDGGGLRA